MKQLVFLLSFLALLFSNTQIAAGQIPTAQNQGQYPYQSMIENIPVTVHFDAGRNGLPEDVSLIVSAFAPLLSAATNVRRSSPLLIGETRIYLSGLSSPLEISVAAPSPVTREIDYARIEAKIVDSFGTTIYELRQSGEYRGVKAPILMLSRIGETPQTPISPVPKTVTGTIELGGAAPQFRGSNLVVQLLEDGLAGGNGQLVVGKTKLSLDGKTAPFNFSFQQTAQSDSLTPLVLDAWIEDWAGRKTHTLPQPMQYNGPNISYRLPLQPTSTNPSSPQDSTSYEREVKGEARFNAHKGLPKGSVLIAELEQNTAGTRPTRLGKTIVKLDGLSGNVAFTIDLFNQRIDHATSNNLIRVRVEDKNGQVFFSNPGGSPLRQGFNAVDLKASPQY